MKAFTVMIILAGLFLAEQSIAGTNTEPGRISCDRDAAYKNAVQAAHSKCAFPVPQLRSCAPFCGVIHDRTREYITHSWQCPIREHESPTHRHRGLSGILERPRYQFEVTVKCGTSSQSGFTSFESKPIHRKPTVQKPGSSFGGGTYGTKAPYTIRAEGFGKTRAAAKRAAEIRARRTCGRGRYKRTSLTSYVAAAQPIPWYGGIAEGTCTPR